MIDIEIQPWKVNEIKAYKKEKVTILQMRPKEVGIYASILRANTNNSEFMINSRFLWLIGVLKDLWNLFSDHEAHASYFCRFKIRSEIEKFFPKIEEQR